MTDKDPNKMPLKTLIIKVATKFFVIAFALWAGSEIASRINW